MFLTTLLEPFQFDFMVNALIVSALVAIPVRYCRYFWCSKAGRSWAMP